MSCSTAESKPTNRSLSLKPATGVAAIAASVQGKLKLLPWATWVAADACEAPPTKAAADKANAAVCVHKTEVMSDPRELIHAGSRRNHGLLHASENNGTGGNPKHPPPGGAPLG